MQVLWQDIRYALRGFARTPEFTVVAVLTIALGMGATSSIYSVVDAVLLRPLPFPEPDRIVEILREFQGGGVSVQDFPTFEFLREHYRSCSYVAASIPASGTLVAERQAEPVDLLNVSADYFEVFGVEPAHGREFSLEDEKQGSPLSLVLSHEFWTSRFGSEASIIGETVRLDGEMYAIVGVMPADFRPLPAADVWTPLRIDFRGGGTNYQVLGRLRSGVALAQAQSELEGLAVAFREEGLRLPQEQRLVAMTYQDRLALSAETELFVLLGAVGMVLLIACANTACLLLARAAGRRREFAVRASLGGGTRRITRQVLTESVVLGMFGGGLGLLLAGWGAQGLVALGPAGYFHWGVSVDTRVVLATLAVASATGVLFGMAPALQARRVDIWGELQSAGGRTASGGRARLRDALVISEVALCTVLLIGAGLLVRTYVNLRNVELGFDPEGVVAARMRLQGAGYESAREVAAFFDESLARLRELPGVDSAAAVSNLPVERGLNLPIRIPHGLDAGEITSVDWRYASPEYFEVMSIPLLRGRYLGVRDAAGSPPVAVVNREFARRFFGDDDPIGVHVELHRFSDEVDDAPRQIVGVVGDVKTRGLAGPARPTMFVPVGQLPDGLLRVVHGFFQPNWVIRSRPGAEISPAAREVLSSLDPLQAFIGTRTMDQVVESSIQQQRFQSALIAVFAALALAMAAGGIYGLIAYAVSQRTREIGIRMALGASAETVLGTIVRQGVTLGAIGVMLGVVASLALTRFLQSFVFGVSTSDPATFGVVGTLLVGTAALASLIPALSVLRLDPAATLRNE